MHPTGFTRYIYKKPAYARVRAGVVYIYPPHPDNQESLMDRTIGVDRWITVAEAEVDDVEGALNALGAGQTADGIVIHDLADLDDAGVAAYLKVLAARLQVVATNLNYLADHADLTDIVESLKSPRLIPDLPAESTTEDPTPARADNLGTNPELDGKTVEELLAMLDDPTGEQT